MNQSVDNYGAVKEMLLDEQKIVTYITLANELCIHVNEAKRLLNQVLRETRKESNIHLSVNYIVSGICEDNSAQTIVCSEDDLGAKKKCFKAVLFEHIYSISQGKSCVDSAAIVSLNRFDDLLLCPGLIKSGLCSKRSVQEFEQLKEKNLQKNESESEIKSTKFVKKENKKEVVTNGFTNGNEKIKAEPVSPTKELSNGTTNKTNSKPISKGLTGFFTKSQSASSIKSSKTEDDSKNGTSKTEHKESKNIANFFTKSNSAPIVKTNSAVDEKPQKKVVKPNTKKETNESMDIDVTDVEDLTEKKIKTEAATSINGTKKNKSLSQIKKNAKVDKKRKRVLQVSDSDSDEDPFADDKAKELESEDEIPPTPATNTVKITSGILNPKKRRKIVDKTYTGEDGYILTRKEEVYESCSDEETDSPKTETNTVKTEKENVVKPNEIKMEISPRETKAIKNNKKKISPPQKGKQATLMNFFKKV